MPTTAGHFRRLIEAAFLSVEPAVVHVDDEQWVEVFGPRLYINGGVELRIRPDALSQALEGMDDDDDCTDETLLPFAIYDRYHPWPLAVLVHVSTLKRSFITASQGRGPRCDKNEPVCDHTKEGFCESCFFTLWQGAASKIRTSYTNTPEEEKKPKAKATNKKPAKSKTEPKKKSSKKKTKVKKDEDRGK